MSEYARRALGAQITRPLQDDKGRVKVISLDPRLEQQIVQGVRQTPNEISLVMEPKLARHLVDTLSSRVQKMLADGLPPVVVCGPYLRLPFRRFFETTFADLSVLAYPEIPARVEIQNAEVIPCPE